MQGTGKRLGDIPNVNFRLGKMKPDDELLSHLHTLLFKRPGGVCGIIADFVAGLTFLSAQHGLPS